MIVAFMLQAGPEDELRRPEPVAQATVETTRVRRAIQLRFMWAPRFPRDIADALAPARTGRERAAKGYAAPRPSGTPAGRWLSRAIHRTSAATSRSAPSAAFRSL